MIRRRLAGGDIGQTVQVGDRVEKTYDRPGLAAAETAGLRWLDVPEGPPVPQVHEGDEHTVVLDHVEEGSATRAGAERFGRELAGLHGTPAEAWGCSPSGTVFLGWLALDVGEHPCWADLWRARTAALLARLPEADPAPYDRAGERLESLVPDDGPRRVHGDLWSGNVLWDTSGTGWLIDPAAHGGHPELDLAMLALFGSPHLDVLQAAWAEAAAPADGWRERLALHQVHALLFHAVAFGGGYLSRATDIVTRVG